VLIFITLHENETDYDKNKFWKRVFTRVSVTYYVAFV